MNKLIMALLSLLSVSGQLFATDNTQSKQEVAPKNELVVAVAKDSAAAQEHKSKVECEKAEKEKRIQDLRQEFARRLVVLAAKKELVQRYDCPRENAQTFWDACGDVASMFIPLREAGLDDETRNEESDRYCQIAPFQLRREIAMRLFDR